MFNRDKIKRYIEVQQSALSELEVLLHAAHLDIDKTINEVLRIKVSQQELISEEIQREEIR